jgi:hypothetical protein
MKSSEGKNDPTRHKLAMDTGGCKAFKVTIDEGRTALPRPPCEA